MENRITALIQLYGTLILASVFKNKYLSAIMVLLAIHYLYRYIKSIKHGN